jgi:signal transduction histidine kinase
MLDRSSPGTVATKPTTARRGPGLAARMLFLTIAFIMLADMMVYANRITNFRDEWLRNRLASANTAALVFAAAPDGTIPHELAKQVLDSVGAKSIAIKISNTRRLLAVSDAPPVVNDSYDFRDGSMSQGVAEAARAMFAHKGSILKIVGDAPMGGDFLELTIDETPLTLAMRALSRRFLLSVTMTSLGLALLIWGSTYMLVLAPVRRLTSNIVAFGESPEDASRMIEPSGARHEIGRAEEALAQMQRALRNDLGQQRRLADLGLAVAKISHDLRNMLTAAQLFSDRLATIEDPLARRLAPRLVATLDRAIAFCQETLAYGAVVDKPLRMAMFALRPLIEEVVESSAAFQNGTVAFVIDVPADFELYGDPDQFARIVENIKRNAVQALEANGSREGREAAVRFTAGRADGQAFVAIEDTGPGVPPSLSDRIFEPFKGSMRPGGSGLGLAIATDLAHRHGGSIRLEPAGADDAFNGARFVIALPDRAIAPV